MKRQDKILYNFLTENSSKITDKWLETRERRNGSIYSVDSEEKVERMLREQNALTIQTIASSLLEDKEEMKQNVNLWASIVAESRVNSETPIYEVIDAVNKFEDTLHQILADFVEDNDAVIDKQDVLRWNRKISCAFSQLIKNFSKIYYEITRERLFSQEKLIQDLSTPIIPIFESIAVLPLIGELDSLRADKLIDAVPQRCVELQIEHLFIDLSGMPMVDTMVAHQLYQLISVLSLLGISSTVSGIRPEVAQTSTQMGIRFDRGSTYSTLKQALLAEGIRLN